MDSLRRSKAVRETVRTLRSEAIETNERRLLVLSGAHESCRSAAKTAVEAGSFDGTVVTVSKRDLAGERVDPRAVGDLLGTTHGCVVLDCHDGCVPNALGAATGTVDGGGLLILLTPPLPSWAETDCELERMLVSPPDRIDAVGTRFKRRLVRTLRSHRGIEIIDADSVRKLKSGCTDPAPRAPPKRPTTPERSAFPSAVYDACLTTDQRDAVERCESLLEAGTAIVLEADRGRGKSSAAGLAAAALATAGSNVLVTAPSYRNATELFDRAAESLRTLDALSVDDRDGSGDPELRTVAGGAIRFRKPQPALEGSADVLFVDEAAALPVRILERLLSVASSSCFTTTVRGYEGAGRGFDVRFRDRLEDAREVTVAALSEPIRYASGDPIEVWLFHALLLGATPPPSSLVEEFTPAEATYERLDRERLAAEETLLREAFGLLVSAHYRTEPNDLARLLDAPNVAVRALTVDGHVASIALLGREGGLEESRRRAAYEGERIEGNLVPDLLTSQLRDPDAGVPIGLRVMRIATHHGVRSVGFGSRLLEEIEAEFDAGGNDERAGAETVDYLSTSYGATQELCRFWRSNGYLTIHLSSTRNETSGEHSVVMLRPLSSDGRALTERHAEWFGRRISDVLSGPLRSADPDVVRSALASATEAIEPSLSAFEWRLVASAAYGPGQYGVAPGPFRRLALRALLDESELLDADAERLLVVGVLQNRSWRETADALGYASERACLRALGDAFQPIVDAYGGEVAHTEADRYRSRE